MTLETVTFEGADGVRLACRVAGRADAPPMVFLHGFPEGAFAWDALLAHFADRYRCVAPWLRGYAPTSAPADVAAYRTRHLVGDLVALTAQLGGRLAALVAHDWGGAVAWAFAARHAARLARLVIVNSPHPAAFLRELQRNPAQQAASAYMNALRRPDAEQLLAENDFARLWRVFEPKSRPAQPQPGANWLTAAMKLQYRELWQAGLTGPLNWYRATPLHPPTPGDDALLHLPPLDDVIVTVPTHVVWAEDDCALLPALAEGLQAWVPRLTVARVPQATHWVIHEQPARIAQEIEQALRTT